MKYSNKKALIISIIPLILLALFSVIPFTHIMHNGFAKFLFLWGIIFYYPLFFLGSSLLKFKKKKTSYQSQYFQLRYEIILGLLPLILFLGGSLLASEKYYDIINMFIGYYLYYRSIIFLGIIFYLVILYFLSLTKRLRWYWFWLWYFMLWIMVIYKDAFLTCYGCH